MSPRPASLHRDRAISLLKERKTAQQVHKALKGEVSVRTIEGWARGLGLRTPGQRGSGQGPRAKEAGPRAAALEAIDLLLQMAEGAAPGDPVEAPITITLIADTLGRTPQAIRDLQKRWLKRRPATARNKNT